MRWIVIKTQGYFWTFEDLMSVLEGLLLQLCINLQDQGFHLSDKFLEGIDIPSSVGYYFRVDAFKLVILQEGIIVKGPGHFYFGAVYCGIVSSEMFYVVGI